MSIRNHLLAFAITAGLSGAPAVFAQVDEAAPQPSAPEATAEPTPPLQNNAPADPATAESDASASAAAPGTATAAPIDDKKIDQFATAYVEVASIQRNASAQLQSASDPAKAEAVKANAESQMIAAVERNGLDVNEFNRIVETMAADDSIRSRVAAKVQERTGPTEPAAPATQP